jgi:hypothetical protein
VQRARFTTLFSATFLLFLAGAALAHDAANPLAIFEPGAKVERAAYSFHQKVKAAEAAGVPARALQTARFVVWGDLAWPTHTITVCFWNGAEEMQDFVMKTASVWSDVSDLTFIYQSNGKTKICEDAASAFIRINLDPEAPIDLFVNQEGNAHGDWSYIGRDSLSTDLLVTMNLPDVERLRDKAPLWTIHAIRHEFGHALALMHEHQRALCDAWFDYDKISKATGWTVEFAKTQIGKFPDSEVQYLKAVGDYDRKSIMQYNFAKEEFVDIPGKKNPCFREAPINDLSQQDIEGIQAVYGMPAVAAGQRKGQPETVPASQPDSAVAAARADLGKMEAMMLAEASAGNRSGKATADAKAAAAAFSEVVAAVKDIEAVVPPR